MAINMSELKKGLKIEVDKIPYRIMDYQHVKPGKGPAFVRCKIKSFLNGKTIEKTFHAGDKCDSPNIEQKTMQFLYDDGEFLQLMDTQTYEQIGIDSDIAKEEAKWIIDGMNVEVLFFNEKAISIEPPATVELKVTDTPPNFKGDSQGGKKQATIESGAVVLVPFHILEGDKIKVDTKSGDYLEKVK
jgi:elongation factor P